MRRLLRIQTMTENGRQSCSKHDSVVVGTVDLKYETASVGNDIEL